MPNLPGKVAAALEKLRADSPPPPYIILRKIHGGYYVYKDLISKDKVKGKKRLSSEYIGRITDDGVFIKRAITKDDELENARAVIEARGGKVILPERTEVAEPAKILSPDRIDNEILTILSMNARATLPFIAKRVGLSVSAVDNRIRHLEKRYGIKYIAEINIEKLGYLKFIILVRFLDKVPSALEIKRALESEPLVQLVMTLSGGDYQLMMYVLAKSNDEVNTLAVNLQNNDALINYSAEWFITPFRETYNFVPLRSEFMDTLNIGPQKLDPLETKVPRKKKEILNREFAVLKELNNNGVINFTEIDEKYGFDKGRSQYSYHTLLTSGLLKRTTITLQGLGVRYLAVVFLKAVYPKIYLHTREQLLENIIEETSSIINKYILVGDIGMPYGSVLISSVVMKEDLEGIEIGLSKIRGTAFQIEISSNVLIGKVCQRKFDNLYSRQTDRLIADYGHKMMEKDTYF